MLKGNTHMFAGLQSENNYAHYQHHNKHHRHSNATNTYRDNSFWADSNIEAEEYIIDDEDQDEDTDNIQSAKYKLLARSHATHAYPPYPSILNYLCSHFKAVPSICIPASDKYLIQGVLRI
jgi:hypothetical protein